MVNYLTALRLSKPPGGSYQNLVPILSPVCDFSMLLSFLLLLIFHFDFEDRILVLIEPIPGHNNNKNNNHYI